MLIPILIVYLSFTFLILTANNFSFSQGEPIFILIFQNVLIDKKELLSKTNVLQISENLRVHICNVAFPAKFQI